MGALIVIPRCSLMSVLFLVACMRARFGLAYCRLMHTSGVVQLGRLVLLSNHPHFCQYFPNSIMIAEGAYNNLEVLCAMNTMTPIAAR